MIRTYAICIGYHTYLIRYKPIYSLDKKKEKNIQQNYVKHTYVLHIAYFSNKNLLDFKIA